MSPSQNTAGMARLAVCVLGIYIFFLTWGVTQERLTSLPYRSIIDGTAGRFRHFLLLNVAQSLVAVLVSFGFMKLQGINMKSMPSRDLLFDYAKVALSGCLASPFGYAALKHINYPTMILGKSCKLVPLMLMSFVVYRKQFERYKYVTVGLITAGVSGFMMWEGSGKKHGGGGHSGSLFGIALLLINLLLDGLTNSWQDQLFIKHRIRSQQLMFFMNLFASLFMAAYLLLSNPLTGELSASLAFCATHPRVLLDMALFCVCGAMGQVFIFLTIEQFGSLVLVTVTVTRKLFTILLSLFWFQHALNFMQWASVALVFAALGIESFYKRLHNKQHVKAQ